MFIQDLSNISNMIQKSWADFHKSTFTTRRYETLDRLKEKDIERFCPGSSYAADKDFRRALFNYIKSLLYAKKKCKDLEFYKFLAYINGSWTLCSSSSEIRKLELKYAEFIIDLSHFNSAYKTDTLQSNGLRVTKYALRQRSKFVIKISNYNSIIQQSIIFHIFNKNLFCSRRCILHRLGQ